MEHTSQIYSLTPTIDDQLLRNWKNKRIKLEQQKQCIWGSLRSVKRVTCFATRMHTVSITLHHLSCFLFLDTLAIPYCSVPFLATLLATICGQLWWVASFRQSNGSLGIICNCPGQYLSPDGVIALAADVSNYSKLQEKDLLLRDAQDIGCDTHSVWWTFHANHGSLRQWRYPLYTRLIFSALRWKQEWINYLTEMEDAVQCVQQRPMRSRQGEVNP